MEDIHQFNKKKLLSHIQEKYPEFFYSKLSKKTKQSILSELTHFLYKQTAPEIQLRLGDCLHEMKEIPPTSVDLILTDLPYGATKNTWDVIIPFEDLWKEYTRIIKDNGAIILFGNQPFTSLLITSNLHMFRYTMVWSKNKFSDFLNANKKPMKIHEDILIFYKHQPVYNIQYTVSTPYVRWNKQSAIDKQTNYNTYNETTTTNEDGKRLPTTLLQFNRVERPIHPTQKPESLLKRIILGFSKSSEYAQFLKL
jgi:site-specific DNA-methyltransferase (adenine-specific)